MFLASLKMSKLFKLNLNILLEYLKSLVFNVSYRFMVLFKFNKVLNLNNSRF